MPTNQRLARKWARDREASMAQPKVIVNLYPVLPANGEEDRAARRPLGRDAALYHSVLHEMTDVVKAADELGA